MRYGCRRRDVSGGVSMRFLRVWALALILLCTVGNAPARAGAAWRDVTLRSAVVTGRPALDTIWMRYYPAAGVSGRAPAVVALPPVGAGERSPLMRRLAETLSRRGIGCVILALPYHGRRKVRGEVPAFRFSGGGLSDLAQVYHQSASDVSTVVTWLRSQPEVNAERIGVLGISLGAIVAHLAMGRDERIDAGVAALGGGDLPDLFHSSILARITRLFESADKESDPAVLRPVDPLTYANRNRPRRVLMIQAARDLLVPPENAEKLWEALGRPPIRWIDANHMAPGLAEKPLFATATAFFHAVWNGDPEPAAALPRLYVPTLKAGWIVSAHSGASPAVQWQFHTFVKRPDHISLLHANLGVDRHGPFASLAATIGPNLDVGVARSLDGGTPRVYASIHLVY